MKRLFFLIILVLSLGFFYLSDIQATFRSAVVGGGVGVSCTAACEDSNITLFWRGESDTSLNTSQSCGSNLDYNASGSDPTIDGSPNASIGSTYYKTQSNAMDFAGGGCSTGQYMTYDFENGTPANIWDGGDMKLAFWWYIEENCGDASSMLIWDDTGGGTLIVLITWEDKLQIHYNDDAGSNCETGAFIVDDTWYWIEIVVDIGTEAKITAYDTDGDAVSGGTCSPSGDINDIGTPDLLQTGNIYGSRYTDQYIDQMIVSTDPAADLWQYNNDVSYSECTVDE
jgi:hypothetical protein